MRKNVRLFCGIISAWACLPDEKGIYNKFAAQISEFTPSVSQTSQPDPGAESRIHSAQVDKGRRKIRQECVRCVCLYSCVCVGAREWVLQLKITRQKLNFPVPHFILTCVSFQSHYKLYGLPPNREILANKINEGMHD